MDIFQGNKGPHNRHGFFPLTGQEEEKGKGNLCKITEWSVTKATSATLVFCLRQAVMLGAVLTEHKEGTSDLKVEPNMQTKAR